MFMRKPTTISFANLHKTASQVHKMSHLENKLKEQFENDNLDKMLDLERKFGEIKN